MSQIDPSRSGARGASLLAIALGVALAVRLLALYQFAHVETLYGDENYYAQATYSIAAGLGHPGSLRPPLYPAVAAAALGLAGSSDLVWVRLLQIALSLATVALVFSLAAGRFGPRAGLFAALACALAPPLVHFTHFLWSETLQATLLTAAVWLLDRHDRHGGLLHLAAAGCVLGLCALTRETWLYFTPLVALWLVWRRGWSGWGSAVRVVALASAVCATVAPWTLRNLERGESALISTNRWFPTAVGNLYPRDQWFLGTERDRTRGYLNEGSTVAEARRRAPEFRSEQERESYWRRRALEAIRADQPFWIVKKTLRNTARLFYLRSEELRFLALGWVQPGRASAIALLLTDVAGTLAFVSLALLGLWRVRGAAPEQLTVLALVFVIAVQAVTVAVPRFLVPLLPLLAIPIGPLLARSAGEAAPRWRWIGGALCVAAYLLLPLPLNLRFLAVVAARIGGVEG